MTKHIMTVRSRHARDADHVNVWMSCPDCPLKIAATVGPKSMFSTFVEIVQLGHAGTEEEKGNAKQPRPPLPPKAPKMWYRATRRA